MSFRLKASSFRGDARASATVEFVLTLPIFLGMLGLIVYGGETFAIERKVTQAARTLTDLAARQTNVGTSSATYTYSQILDAASLVMAPYDPSPLSMVLSEAQLVTPGNGIVIWSMATSGATALTVGQTVSLQDVAMSTTGATTYVLIGTVAYTYQPLAVTQTVGPISMTRSMSMSPRDGTNVQCCS